MAANVQFLERVPAGDPLERPCTILGKKENLKAVPFTKISPYLGDKVSAQSWASAVDTLVPSHSSSCGLYLNKATLGGVPNVATRHNTPSRSHALYSLVLSSKKQGPVVAIVVVCFKTEVVAYTGAIARAFPIYNQKSNDKEAQTVQVGFILVGDEDTPLDSEQVSCLNNLSDGVRLAQEIVDTPTNIMHTDGFLDKVRKVGEATGIKPFIIQGEELQEKGFGGIYGVGKAAVHQPALAVLSHTPPGATENICWVGKGIVYDTGGLSIKTKVNMPGMKRDCGGAAGILGAFLAAVKLGFKQNLHAVLCLAENAVGPVATRPDDVHTLYSGKTVEINNTDAEGRLVLGDGVAYARNVLKADWVLDMATLTGAQGISTGVYHGGVLTNCENSQQAVQEAGRISGDLTFPLPYTPELHFKEFDSSVADMKNSVMNRANAQSSCAGLFINAHLGFDYSGVWIHIDMASPVHCGERATGYGVALLNTLYGQYSENSLLQSSAPKLEKSSNVDHQ